MLRLLPAAIAVLACLAAGPAAAAELEVPVDLGIGPAGCWFTGPIGANQPVHGGLKLSLAAVLDREFINAHLDRVPPRYRAMASRMDEVRYRPSLLIPESLWISPRVGDVGVYGVTWRPVGVAIPLAKGDSRLDLGAGLLLTAAYLHGNPQVLPSGSMVFVRPGIDVTLRWEVPVIEDAFLVAVGWTSQIYLPQKLGGSLLESGGFDAGSLWHVGQLFVTLHWRILYTVDL